jgi:hypothetical protein
MSIIFLEDSDNERDFSSDDEKDEEECSPLEKCSVHMTYAHGV